jgi:hypothetical protein
VRPDGTVKVLDFGLAKALDQSPASSSQTTPPGLSMSPTITSPAMTAAGIILLVLLAVWRRISWIERYAYDTRIYQVGARAPLHLEVEAVASG